MLEIEFPEGKFFSPQLRQGISELTELFIPFSFSLVQGWCLHYEFRSPERGEPADLFKKIKEDMRYGIYHYEPLPYFGLSLSAYSLVVPPLERAEFFKKVGHFGQDLQKEMENIRMKTTLEPITFMGESLGLLHGEVASYGEASRPAQCHIFKTLLHLKNTLTLSHEKLLFEGYQKGFRSAIPETQSTY